QECKEGDKVNLMLNSSVQTGQFFPRFPGLPGTITGKRGFCYQVKVFDQNKEKTVFVHPIHLKKQE
ncbi:MAG: 50S ribosomal protein L21e, partial [Nanoarchaeota archaeon]